MRLRQQNCGCQRNERFTSERPMGDSDTGHRWPVGSDHKQGLQACGDVTPPPTFHSLPLAVERYHTGRCLTPPTADFTMNCAGALETPARDVTEFHRGTVVSLSVLSRTRRCGLIDNNYSHVYVLRRQSHVGVFWWSRNEFLLTGISGSEDSSVA